ncbi:MAG: LptE family protein [Candidatus Brocadiales bacterium]|nr:LptE family protein [Candidatus Brocadiales bacterium]
MKKIKQLIIWCDLGNRISFRQFLCALVFLALISGCGYTTKSLISRNINSVYIPIFGNYTFRNGLEFELTKALKDEIMSRTKLGIAGIDDADTILTGKIIRVDEGATSSNAFDNLVESSISITVNFSLADRRTGRQLIAVDGLTGTGAIIITRGETINTGIQEAVERLATKIVYELEEKW